MPLKCGTVDKEKIKVKLDQIKYSNQNRKFRPTMIGWRNYLQGTSWRILSKGEGFLSKLRPKTRKLCVMEDCASMDELFIVALEVERVVMELGETAYELLK